MTCGLIVNNNTRFAKTDEINCQVFPSIALPAEASACAAGEDENLFRYLNTCTVLPMVCLNFWSPKANVWSPEVLDLTITSFDYVATNVVGSQNMMQSLSSVSSSKLSQWPALTENTTMTKFCVNKCFLSLALNITTCDAGVQKQSWMSCITEEMNDKKNQQESKAESCDSSTKFSFILNCCVLFSLLALEQTMNGNITVLIRFCAYC